MYEINLVPDVKGELLKQQKLRNLIITVCLIVMGVCGGLVVILLGISSGQNISISKAKDEIKCRYSGIGEHCGDYLKDGSKDGGTSTAIMKFENAEDVLTIQKQMENVGKLNDEKVKLSRIFGVLDVILPNDGHDEVKLTELSVDLLGWSIYFNATANSDNGIHFRAVENFQKGIARSYYDYGNYMRTPKSDESGESTPVKIPEYCIDEITAGGYVFGVYHKGMPYCEENIIVDKNSDDDEKKTDEDKKKQEQEYTDKLDKARSELGAFERIYEKNNVYYKVSDVYIRRTYNDEDDKSNYPLGKNEKEVQNKIAKESSDPKIAEAKTGYYFESECLTYNNDKKLDEDATREKCPVLSSDLVLGEQGIGRDSSGRLLMSFESNVPLSKNIFLAKNDHMQIKSPTRQNVTDSYIQVRDMFSEKLKTEGEVK